MRNSNWNTWAYKDQESKFYSILITELIFLIGASNIINKSPYAQKGENFLVESRWVSQNFGTSNTSFSVVL